MKKHSWHRAINVAVALVLVAMMLPLFPQPVQAAVDWWDTNYPYRRAISANETEALARTNEPFSVNITGLTGVTADQSLNEKIRIVSNWTGTQVDIPFQVLDYGTDGGETWCDVVFLGNASASAINEEKFYVYYGYDGGDPGYIDNMTNTLTGTTWDFDTDNITWRYEWSLSARTDGPAMTTITTPDGTSLSLDPGNTYAGGADDLEASETYTSLVFEVDGPIYKRALLTTTVRTQYFHIYAEQNWLEVYLISSSAQLGGASPGTDYMLVPADTGDTTPLGSFYYDNTVIDFPDSELAFVLGYGPHTLPNKDE